MKKTFNLLLLVLLLVGCSKEFEESNSQTEELTSNYSFSTGSDYASFESKEAFDSFLTNLNTQTGLQIEELIKELDYLSFNDFVIKAYEGMNYLETREEFINYIEDYKDYFKIVTRLDGEEEVIEIDFTLHSISPFLNKDRIIKVGNDFYKYMGNYCIISNNYSELTAIKNVEQLKTSRLENYIVTKMLYDSDLRWGGSR